MRYGESHQKAEGEIGVWGTVILFVIHLLSHTVLSMLSGNRSHNEKTKSLATFLAVMSGGSVRSEKVNGKIGVN
ncbi:hypothetical protein CI238_07083 [Colletotrichum incanum]|uniref:Uncharacterized protein n=1 Tax=Colletotrichum incanum TaxID=1573173 RepID=A0A166MS33_COLIC|nr:hypothetical protein CI238_07083 [Colletotrichum incanum]